MIREIDLREAVSILNTNRGKRAVISYIPARQNGSEDTDPAALEWEWDRLLLQREPDSICYTTRGEVSILTFTYDRIHKSVKFFQ